MFGGGYSMLPLLERDVVKKGWATDDDITDYLAISQVTPGIIAVNVATFVGCKIKGSLGAIVATFGLVLPSIMTITLIASLFSFLLEDKTVEHIFNGVLLVIPALIFPALLKMIKNGVKDVFSLIVFGGVFVLALMRICSPVWLVVSSAFLSVLIFILKAKKA